MNGSYLEWEGARLEGPDWQGITHLSIALSVVDPDTGETFEAVVTVYLARPASGLSAESVTVEGGQRITDLRPLVLVNEGSTTIELRFQSRGDHSDYVVRLLDGGDAPLHPFFSEARFNFFVECEAGDCRPKPLLPDRTPGKPPAIDLRDKDFKGFLKILSDWIKVHNPDWADLSPASLERVLVELLSHQADLLSYYQDRVSNEAFIGTASQRYSLNQHAALLGYPVFDGGAARTVLAFETTSGGFVPAGLSVQMPRLSGERPVVFYIRQRTRVDPRNNSVNLIDRTRNLRPAAWPGAQEAVVPLGATRLLLWEQSNALERGMRLAVSQGDFWQIVTLTNVRRLEQPGWVSDPSEPLSTTPQALTEINWEEPLKAPLYPWDPERPLRLFGNLADASHGEARTTWILPSATTSAGEEAASEPGPRDLVQPLNRRNSIIVARRFGDGSEALQLRALLVPEGPVLFDRRPDGRLEPVLEVFVGRERNGDRWIREEHLHNSRFFDPHYVAHTDNDGRIWLQFGDGVQGRAIHLDPNTRQPLEPIRIAYRVGDPLDGNCSRESLTEIIRPVPLEFEALGHVEVTNVAPGLGGRQPQSLDEIREAIPTSLRHSPRERAVALKDYAEAAMEVRGVERAAAKAIGGPFNTVLILVDPEGQADLSEELKQRVHRRIEQVRMAGREHVIAAPEYVPLEVRLIVCAQPGFLRHEVRDRVLAALRPGTGDRPGYFHPNNLSFGRDLLLGDVLSAVQSIPGVRSVKATTFDRLSAADPEVVPRIVLAATEVARLDADENMPENGVLELAIVGLDEFDEDAFSIVGPADTRPNGLGGAS